MFKFFSFSLVPSSVIFTTAFLALPMNAEETKTPNPIISNEVEETNDLDFLNQVTSVSQLSDVQPTDWAFQALQSLVERYGCIAGYPNGTYRGNRAMTRYEFAAGLNACMEKVSQLISTGTNLVRKEDLTKLQKLQEEFASEITTIRGRVDSLETRTAELEAQQFSTTTKLQGEAIFTIADAFRNKDTNNTVFQQRVRLNLNTSFSGKDLLITRLQVGNSSPFNLENNNKGVNFLTTTSEGFQSSQVFANTNNNFNLDTLQYQFPVGNKLRVTIAANAGTFDDFTPTLNPFFENSDGGNGAISAFAQRNPIYRLGGGAGLGLSYKFNQELELTLGYLSSTAANPSQNNGIFNGDYAALTQITWNPTNNFGVGLTYNRAYFGNGRFGFDNGGGSVATGNLPFTGTALANRVGATNQVTSNSAGLQLAWRPNPKFQINGWVGYTKVDLLQDKVSADILNAAVLLGFPDLFKRGNFGGLVVGIEPYLTNLDGFNSQYRRDIPLHIEGFYKVQVTDNISITPGVIWLTSPNQDADNDNIVIGTLRTTFRF